MSATPEFTAFKRRVLRDPRVRFYYVRAHLRSWIREMTR